MTHDPTWMTAGEARAAMAAQELDAETLVRAGLDRIAGREAQVRAWSHLDPVLALAQARERDKTAVQGPLHGVPVAVKDVILTQDMPTQYNSPGYVGFHPRLDASCVRLLRQAGAVIMGKTDTVEFAAVGRKALTRNPHDLARTPGGSSSGSAAAVADGHVPLALGTQTGGSMIRPASFCGVFAMKPTWGVVSAEGAKTFAVSLDTIGWFARSAGDLRRLYDVFDPAPAPVEVAPVRRIGICRTPMWARAGEDTRDLLAATERRLAEAGLDVVALELPDAFEGVDRLQMTLMRSEARAAFLAERHGSGPPLHPDIAAMVDDVDGTKWSELVEVYDRLAELRRTFDALAGTVDAVLAPSTVGEAPLGLAATGDLVFNGLWTALHTPCVNLPMLRDAAALPLGLTLVGPRFQDRRVLDAADAVSAVPGLVGCRAPPS